VRNPTRKANRSILAALATTAAWLLAASPAAAITPQIEYATGAVSPERDGGVSVRAAGARVCELWFSGPSHRFVGPFVANVHHPNVQWSWQVPANATRGRWVAIVQCARSRRGLRSRQARPAGAAIVVRGWRRSEPASIVAGGSMMVRSTPSDPRGFVARSPGGLGWNPFPYGQCTYHAFDARPDIYDYSTSHGVPLGGTASGNYYGGVPDYTWNAWHWLGNAQAAGIPTGGRPFAGALAVFPQGYGGSSVGHLGYVLQVLRHGSYLVSEENWNGNSNVTERVVHPYPGVRFVYGGPAGDGPRP
jgi:surface antigen